MVKKIYSKKDKKITIAIIAKYIESGNFVLKDSYASLLEAIDHAAWREELATEIVFINAEKLGKKDKKSLADLKNADGIIVPIGWGKRGVEGKIKAIQYAREEKVPYLGLCYGMQLASIEFARNVCGLKDANSSEFDSICENPVIDLMADQKSVVNMGGTLRLGNYECTLRKDTLAYADYKKDKILERQT